MFVLNNWVFQAYYKQKLILHAITFLSELAMQLAQYGIFCSWLFSSILTIFPLSLQVRSLLDEVWCLSECNLSLANQNFSRSLYKCPSENWGASVWISNLSKLFDTGKFVVQKVVNSIEDSKNRHTSVCVCQEPLHILLKCRDWVYNSGRPSSAVSCTTAKIYWSNSPQIFKVSETFLRHGGVGG